MGEGRAGGAVGWLFPAPAPSFKGAAHDLAQPLPPTALTLRVLSPLPPDGGRGYQRVGSVGEGPKSPSEVPEAPALPTPAALTQAPKGKKVSGIKGRSWASPGGQR